MTSDDTVYNIIGATGGIILAVSLSPQLYRVIKRRSSNGLSFTRQVIFLIGIIMYIVYYCYWGLWAAFYPTLVSLASIVVLLGLKISLDGLPCRPKATGDVEGDPGVSGEIMARDAGLRKAWNNGGKGDSANVLSDV